MIIAGHCFSETLHGLRCACGVRFVDIASVTRLAIGKPGWAHAGSLNEAEFNQIRAEVDRQWALLVGIASGRGIGGMAPGEMETMGDTT